MRFSVLGPLAVHGPLGAVDVVGGRERSLLAHLVAAGGHLVTVDELADSLWGDRLPRAPGKALQTYVLRLRNALEPERRGLPTVVVTEGSGYRLVVGEDDVDARRFARLAAVGRTCLDAGRPEEAAATLGEALDLWRGPAYTGFEETPFGRAERQRLHELRVSAREDRWAAEVDLGRASIAIPELEQLVAEHPWRERAWAALVLGLFRADRQGDALGALERARSLLAEELGVDPGPELRELSRRVLAHDPTLRVLPGTAAGTGQRPAADAAVRAQAVEVVREESGAVVAAGEELRGGRAALVEGIYALQAIDAREDLPAEVCPWRGLSSYDVGDRPWFAGRERLVAELLARLTSERLVAVVGASGSGKSSLVRAGMLGALADGALPGSAGWTTIVMRPGATPMRELATAAVGVSHPVPTLGDLLLGMAERADDVDDAGRTVLVVDQLEELWTSCEDDRERESFLDALAGIAHETATRVVVVVRGDYYAHLADHAGLAALARDATLLVGVPTAAEVGRMVEVPARAAGLTLDTGLAQTLAEDAGQEPGLLPLLSTALLQLWERRRGRHLTYADYVDIGGLSGAVAHLAEEAYNRLPEEDRDAVRVVLLRLAGRTGVGDVVRRRVSLAELDGLPGSTAEVATSLAGDRLLTLTGDAVEVAHESLFRDWPRLAAWLADDDSARTVLHRLAVAAAQWDEQGRDPGLLWRGAGLQSALDVLAAHPDEVTAVEAGFLAAGEAVLDAERREAEERAEQRERQNHRLRVLLAIAAVLILVAVTAGVLALQSRRDTAAARDREAAAATAADARRLAAASLNEEAFDVALLQAVEAVRSEPGPQTRGALLSLLARTPDLVHLRRAGSRYLRAAASADGTVVAISEYDPVVIGLGAETGEELWSRSVPDDGHVLTLSGGRAGFLLQAYDDEGRSRVHLWDDRTGADVWSISADDLRGVVGPDGDPQPLEAAWSAGGEALVLTPTHAVTVTAEGRPRRAVRLASPGMTGRLVPWPDGRFSYESPLDVTHVVDPRRPRAAEMDPGLPIASISPDGALVLTADRSDRNLVRLRLHDSTTFRPVGQEATVTSFDDGVDWASDGRAFAIGAGEEIQVRDREGRLVRRFTGAHSGAVMAPVFAGPQDGVLWGAGRDALASAWDLSGRLGLLTSTPLDQGPHNGDADPAGAFAVGTLFDHVEPNRAGVMDAGTGRVARLPLPARCACQVASVTLTPDGRTAVGALQHVAEAPDAPPAGSVAVWSTGARELRHELDLPWEAVSASVTPDSTRAVVNGRGGFAVVDLAAGRFVGTPVELDAYKGPATGSTVAVDPKGRSAAVLSADEVVLVDVASGAVTARSDLGTTSATAGGGAALAWVGDDLVVGGFDGRISFLDGDDLSPLAPPRDAAAGFLIDLHAHGDFFSSLGSDGDVRLWDAGTWEPMGLPLVEDNIWGFLAGSDDELRVWFEGPDGRGRGRIVTLPLDPQAWVDRACALAGRQLTADEWAVIRPDQEWRTTCPAA